MNRETGLWEQEHPVNRKHPFNLPAPQVNGNVGIAGKEHLNNCVVLCIIAKAVGNSFVK